MAARLHGGDCAVSAKRAASSLCRELTDHPQSENEIVCGDALPSEQSANESATNSTIGFLLRAGSPGARLAKRPNRFDSWKPKGIIDRHAGSMRIRSSEDPRHHGTVFSLFLPHLSEAEIEKQTPL